MAKRGGRALPKSHRFDNCQVCCKASLPHTAGLYAPRKLILLARTTLVPNFDRLANGALARKKRLHSLDLLERWRFCRALLYSSRLVRCSYCSRPKFENAPRCRRHSNGTKVEWLSRMEVQTFSPKEAPIWGRPNLKLSTLCVSAAEGTGGDADAARRPWWWNAPITGMDTDSKQVGSGEGMSDMEGSIRAAMEVPMFPTQ